MPSKPPRPCRVASCPNLVKGSVGYCGQHKHLAPTGWQAKTKREHQKIYTTRRWIRTSKAYRQQNPLCEPCIDEGVTTSAQVVDHKVPIQDGGAVFDWDNLQSMCHSHHNSKTAKETARRK